MAEAVCRALDCVRGGADSGASTGEDVNSWVVADVFDAGRDAEGMGGGSTTGGLECEITGDESGDDSPSA